MRSQPILLKVLNVLSVILVLAGYYLSIMVAPTEKVMGNVQKVFYFHVATAWVGMLGFVLAAIFAVVYLVKKELKWDSYGIAAVEISLVFFFITIILGSICLAQLGEHGGLGNQGLQQQPS